MVKVLVTLIACLIAGPGWAAQKPLSQDDVQLLLLGGATEQRMLALVSARGVDFQMTPALEKKLRDAGATDPIIAALNNAGPRRSEGAASAPGAGNSSLPPSGHDPSAPAPPAASSPVRLAGPTVSPSATQGAPASNQQAQVPTSASVNQKIAAVLDDLSSHPRERLSEYPYAPMFSLKDLSGRKLDLHDYKGKVVMLDFWATWCGPCRSEIPKFVGLERRYHDQGFQLIGVSVDRSSIPVRSFYRRYGMNYPVALCDSFTRNAYGGLRGVPTTLLIGRDGRIYATVVGAPADLSYFEEKIQTLLAEPANGQKPILAAATKSPANSTTTRLVQVASTSSPPGTASPSRSAAKPAAPNPTPNLSDPSAAEIQRIIQAFAAKEELFKEARDGYTYHQINKVETLDADSQPNGEFEQDWDILYDDNGKRIERVTYAPLDTLKGVLITEQDIDAIRHLQPFVLTTAVLPEYDVSYLGHVKLDELTAYVFRVRPKVVKKGGQYFQGVVWVDDRDLQIVKAEGKPVFDKELKEVKGQQFPRFTTWREQIDGKFWFPTFTMADDTLYFPDGPVHLKEIIKYTDYKQFKSTVKILGMTPNGKTPGNPPKDQKQ
ncbi:MAG TPA: redoxin domain-containing protein [Terriglobia bacterium]|nr:redoxin domain-containing protein [Terriglobia bacterium]